MNSESHILYLQFHKELDREFIYLSRIFLQFGITLVPITVTGLKSYLPKGQDNIIVIVRDIESLKIYRRLLKRFLNFSMRNSKLRVFELSSFPVYHESKLLKDDRLVRFNLPIKMHHFVKKVLPRLRKRSGTLSNVWPGGRRAKLPES